MIVEFTVDKPQNWLRHIAEQFGVEPEDNTINFPPNLGEGLLRHYYLSNGITLNYLRFKFHKEIIFSRKAGNKIPFSPIMFYIHEKKFQQDIEDEIKEICSNSPNGIFWPSHHINSQDVIELKVITRLSGAGNSIRIWFSSLDDSCRVV